MDYGEQSRYILDKNILFKGYSRYIIHTSFEMYFVQYLPHRKTFQIKLWKLIMCVCVYIYIYGMYKIVM